MTTATLESLLEGAVHNLRTEQTSSPAEAQPAPEPDPKPGDGQAEPKPVETGADTDGPPPSHEDEPTDAEGRLKALIGERKKRQETEQKLSEREKELAEFQKRLEKLEGGGQPQSQQPQRPAQQPVAAPDPWLDPEGYARHIQAETEKRSFRDRVEISQELMRSKHEDYDEVEKVFREECKSNPYLAQQLRTSSFPARFAYEQGKRLKALQEIGNDPAAFRAKVEAETKAKIEAEQAAKQQPASAPAPAPAASPTPQPPPPPPSLAGVTSSAPRKAGTKFEGPTPLDAILK